jgi:hypothetical protein
MADKPGPLGEFDVVDYEPDTEFVTIQIPPLDPQITRATRRHWQRGARKSSRTGQA